MTIMDKNPITYFLIRFTSVAVVIRQGIHKKVGVVKII